MNRKGWALLALGAYVGYRLVRKGTAYSFKGKTVVITGGSRGLGLELARCFAREGAALAICARDPNELARASAELGPRMLTHVCDVTVPEQIDAFLEEVKRELGPIDVLVNNAGVIQVGPENVMTFEDFDQAMKTHFYAPLRFMLKLRDQLVARQGRVINIASFGGKVPAPHLLPYDASKFALVGLSEGWHLELKRHGVTVTTVCPGLMRTGSPPRAWFKGDSEAEYSWFAVADSLPYLSISSETAAHQILEASREGRAELILTGRARLASKLHGVAPSLMLWLLTLADALLPEAADGQRTMREGRHAESRWTRSWLTALTRRAARRNNELPV